MEKPRLLPSPPSSSQDHRETVDYAVHVADLVERITDPPLREATLACMAILAGGNLDRDYQRCQRASLATLMEFKREVSPGLLNALLINMIAGARLKRIDDRLLGRVYNLLLSDPNLVDLMLQIATYAEMLAPAAKREAEAFIAEHGTTPARKPQNRS